LETYFDDRRLFSIKHGVVGGCVFGHMWNRSDTFNLHGSAAYVGPYTCSDYSFHLQVQHSPALSALSDDHRADGWLCCIVDPGVSCFFSCVKGHGSSSVVSSGSDWIESLIARQMCISFFFLSLRPQTPVQCDLCYRV
jgi:hypothetical protein